MLDGVNDSDAQARTRRAGDVPCKFNLIPFNPFPDSGYNSPAPRIRRFAGILIDAGIVTTTRKTRRRYRRRVRPTRRPGQHDTDAERTAAPTCPPARRAIR